jgi:hypothetical protein
LSDPRAALQAAFAQQVRWCRAMDSPFTAAVIERSAPFIATTPEAEAAYRPATDDPLAVATALRWAAADAVVVEGLPAADFVERELATRARGATTVLMHSVVWQYLPAAEQRRIGVAMAAAGAAVEREDPASPLAWLRMEPPDTSGGCELRCTLWPGGPDARNVRLACTHPHGRSVEWLGATP